MLLRQLLTALASKIDEQTEERTMIDRQITSEQDAKQIVTDRRVEEQLRFVKALSDNKNVSSIIKSNPELLSQLFKSESHVGQEQYGMSGLMFLMLKANNSELVKVLFGVGSIFDRSTLLMSLLEVVKADEDESSYCGWTMAMLAIRNNSSFFSAILETLSLVERTKLLEKRSPFGKMKKQNGIMFAIREKNFDLVKKLLDLINIKLLEQDLPLYKDALEASGFTPEQKQQVLSKLQFSQLESKQKSTQDEPIILSSSFSNRIGLFDQLGEYPNSEDDAKNALNELTSCLSKTGFVSAAAYSQSQCFFDSFSQSLENLGIVIPSMPEHYNKPGHQKLRDFCQTPKKKWGQPMEEGFALCNWLDVQLHVIEVTIDVNRKIVIYHNLVTSNSKDKRITDEREIRALYDNPRTVHMANYQGSLHFVPVLNTTPLAARLNNQPKPMTHLSTSTSTVSTSTSTSQSTSSDSGKLTFEDVVKLIHTHNSESVENKLSVVPKELFCITRDIIQKKEKDNRYGHTLLTYAVSRNVQNTLHKVRLLLWNCGAEELNIKVQDKRDKYFGKTALQIAEYLGNDGVVVELRKAAGLAVAFPDSKSEDKQDAEISEFISEVVVQASDSKSEHEEDIEMLDSKSDEVIQTIEIQKPVVITSPPIRVNTQRLDFIWKKQNEFTDAENSIVSEILANNSESELYEIAEELIRSVRSVERLLIDAFTQDIGTDWVILPESGHTYDRFLLSEWLCRDGTCPNSRAEIQNYMLAVDYAARELTSAMGYPVDEISRLGQVDHQQIDVELPTTINLSMLRSLVLSTGNVASSYLIRKVVLDFQVPQKDILPGGRLNGRGSITDPKIIAMIYLTCKNLQLDAAFESAFKLKKIVKEPSQESKIPASSIKTTASIPLPEYLEKSGLSESIDVKTKFSKLTPEVQHELVMRLVRFYLKLQGIIRDSKTQEIMKDPVRLQDGSRCERSQAPADAIFSPCLFTRSILDALGYSLELSLRLPQKISKNLLNNFPNELGLKKTVFLRQLSLLLAADASTALFNRDVQSPGIIEAIYKLFVRSGKENTFRKIMGMELLPESPEPTVSSAPASTTTPIGVSVVTPVTMTHMGTHRIFGGKEPSIRPSQAPVRKQCVKSDSDSNSESSLESSNEEHTYSSRPNIYYGGGMGLMKRHQQVSTTTATTTLPNAKRTSTITQSTKRKVNSENLENTVSAGHKRARIVTQAAASQSIPQQQPRSPLPSPQVQQQQQPPMVVYVSPPAAPSIPAPYVIPATLANSVGSSLPPSWIVNPSLPPPPAIELSRNNSFDGSNNVYHIYNSPVSVFCSHPVNSVVPQTPHSISAPVGPYSHSVSPAAMLDSPKPVVSSGSTAQIQSQLGGDLVRQPVDYSQTTEEWEMMPLSPLPSLDQSDNFFSWLAEDEDLGIVSNVKSRMR